MAQENLLAREGESLRKILDRGPLPVARAVRIARDVASGLAHAHLQGVVHGSLKPSSIIVPRTGAAKIAGFGLGPKGEAPDHRGDILAFGAVLYEMLTGRPPVEGRPPAPSELNPCVPRVLDAVVLSMLAGDPSDRMPGVPVLQRELQRLEEGLGLGAEASAPADEPAPAAPPAASEFRVSEDDRSDYYRAVMGRQSRPQRSTQSRRAVLAASALVVGVLAIGGGSLLYFLSDHGERSIAARRVQKTPVAEADLSKEPGFGPWKPAPLHAVSDTQETIKKPAAEPAPEPVHAAAGSGLTVPASMTKVIEKPAAAPEPPAVKPEPPVMKPEPPAAEPPAKVAAAQPAGTATLTIAASPHGELYVDGEHVGATPPITTLDLAPGMHRIEIRSGSRKPYLTYMTVQAGDQRRIRHDFSAKPSSPPV